MPPPMFAFEFQCVGIVDDRQCGAILSGRCYLAVAETRGHYYACSRCGQEYSIMTDGAHPIETMPATESQTFIDAAGKPFVLSTWEPPPPSFPLTKGEQS